MWLDMKRRLAKKNPQVCEVRIERSFIDSQGFWWLCLELDGPGIEEMSTSK